MTSHNPQEGGKHTPGPWRSAPSIRGSQGERLICADDTPPLARVYFVRGQRAGANARLMAAAPDLLEALQWVLSAHGEQLHDAFDAAHKAIAKATGLEVSDVRDRASSRDEGGLRDEPENPLLQATGGENGR